MKSYLDKQREEFRAKLRGEDPSKRAKKQSLGSNLRKPDGSTNIPELKRRLEALIKKASKDSAVNISMYENSCDVSKSNFGGGGRSYVYSLDRLSVTVSDRLGVYYDDYGNSSYSKDPFQNKKQNTSSLSNPNRLLTHFTDTLREFGVLGPPLKNLRNWTFY